MNPSHQASLRWLRTGILLTLGLSPLAACRGTVTIDCSDAKPADNGLVDCGGVQVRPEPTVCTLPEPGDAAACSASFTCTADSDCTAGAEGRCNMDPSAHDCQCTYGCTTDAGCGPDQVCLCTAAGGQCVSARCKTSADCDDGQSCALYDTVDVCSGAASWDFACTTTSDECLSDGQCPNGAQCISDGHHFFCDTATCQTGRPFYVGGEVRTAPLVTSADWASPLRPDVGDVPPAERAAMARRWSHIGQLEHASVASFARFALQLLSLGAPPELVEQATSAMADESLHARLAFGLASAYAGSPVGPGNLEVGDALGANDVGTIVHTLLHEGCVGETLAAALAREERERTADPVVRGILDRIVTDEEKHALLAWRALGWIVTKSGRAAESAAVLSSEMAPLAREVAAARSAAPFSLEDADTGPSGGVLSAAEMASLRVAVLETVVLPSARALLARRAAEGSAGARAGSSSHRQASEGGSSAGTTFSHALTRGAIES